MAEILNSEQIGRYRENGYLVLEDQVPQSVILEVRKEIDRFRCLAKGMIASDHRLDLEDTHRPDDPRVRRIKLPHRQSGIMHDLMHSDQILGPVRDLIGPDIRLHTSKLNMKEAGYGAAVEWHQDCAFYPHTNDDLLAVGVLIDDMEAENGPLMVYPGSHRGPVLDHHVDGVFAGAVNPGRFGFDPDDVVRLTGPAGSISIHHGRALHGSAVNMSDRPRRILFYEMMAADAFPIAGSMTEWCGLDEYDRRMLCGTPTLQPRLENIPVRIPQPQPDRHGSIYEIQKGMTSRPLDTRR